MHDVFAEESGRATRIDAVRGEQDHPAIGCHGRRAGSGPRDDLGARRQRGEDRPHRR